MDYGPGWAQVSNSPNRLWKLAGFDGGNGVSASNPEQPEAMLDLWLEFARRNGILISDTDRRPLRPF